MKTRKRRGGGKGLKATVLLLLAQATHGSGIWEKITSGKRLTDEEVQDAGTTVVKFLQNPSVSYPSDFDPLPEDVDDILKAVRDTLRSPKLVEVELPKVTPYVASILATPAPEFDVSSTSWALVPGKRYTVRHTEGDSTGFEQTPALFVREDDTTVYVKGPDDETEYPFLKSEVELTPYASMDGTWGGRRRRRTVRRRKTLRRKR